MSGVIITSSDDRDRFEIAAQLEQIIEDSDHSVDGLKINPGARHSDWERGDPCPECGNGVLDVAGVESNLYTSEGGELEFHELTRTTGINLHYRCGNCETVLDGVAYTSLDL